MTHTSPATWWPSTRPPAARTHAVRSLAVALLACKPAVPPTTPALPTVPTAETTPGPSALRGPVVSLDLTGTTRDSDARSALTTTLGAAYDPTAISRDVHALWAIGGISDIQVDARPASGGVAVRYRITELPKIRKVEVEGGPALYLSTWRIRTGELTGTVQDSAKLRRLAEDLRDELVSHAFPDARVDWKLVPADAQVDVVFTVTEGPKISLSALTFRGNKKLGAAELESIFRTRGVAVGQPFTAVARDAAQLAVIERYQDLGHINAEFLTLKEPAEARSADGKTISATYEIREGDAYRLGKLVVRGALLAPVREYEKLLRVRPGQPFNRSQIVQGIEKIRVLHRERGAGEPDVTSLTELDDKARKIALTIEISKP